MTVHARYDGKAFIPEEPVELPPGTVVVLTVGVPADGRPRIGVLARLAALAERSPITDSPPDWSEQHDHYFHGTPKR